MTEVTRGAAARIGVDLSKRVFQVHAVGRSGRKLLAKPMAPERFFAWCAELPAGCLVAMEACGGAHHAARRLRLLGRGVLAEFGLVFPQRAPRRFAGCWPRCWKTPATN